MVLASVMVVLQTWKLTDMVLARVLMGSSSLSGAARRATSLFLAATSATERRKILTYHSMMVQMYEAVARARST